MANEDARGHKFYLQLGKQVSPNTPVAATGVRMEMRSFQLDPDQGSAEDPSLIDGLLSPRDIFQFGRNYLGTMVGTARYLGQLKIWEALMGDGTSPATPAASAPDGNGIITNTFKQGFTLPLHTAEVFEGGYDGITTVAQYVDLVITRFRLTGDAVKTGEAGVYSFEAGIAARSRAIGITPAALSLGDEEAAVFKHAGTLVDGLGDAAAAFSCKTFTLEVQNPIDVEAYQQGSVSPIDFVRDGRHTITLTLVIRWRKNTQVAALEAWTDTVPHLVLTGEKTIGAAGHRSIDITIPKAKVIGVSRPIDRFGRIEQTVRYQAKYDTVTSTGLTVLVKNESVSIAAG